MYLLICNSEITWNRLDILVNKLISSNRTATNNINISIPYFYIYDSPIFRQFLNDSFVKSLKWCDPAIFQHAIDYYFIRSIINHPNRIHDIDRFENMIKNGNDNVLFIIPIMPDCMPRMKRRIVKYLNDKNIYVNNNVTEFSKELFRSLLMNHLYRKYSNIVPHLMIHHDPGVRDIFAPYIIHIHGKSFNKYVYGGVYEIKDFGDIKYRPKHLITLPYLPQTYRKIANMTNHDLNRLYNYDFWIQRSRTLFGRFSVIYGAGYNRLQLVMLDIHKALHYSNAQINIDVGFSKVLLKDIYSIRHMGRLEIIRKYILANINETNYGSFNIGNYSVYQNYTEMNKMKYIFQTLWTKKMNYDEYSYAILDSQFCLFIKGDSCTSNRLYECIITGSIPIFIGYECYSMTLDPNLQSLIFPFPNFIAYKEFIFFVEDLVNRPKINYVFKILIQFRRNKTLIQDMLNSMKKYRKYLIWQDTDQKVTNMTLKQTMLQHYLHKNNITDLNDRLSI